MVLSATIKNENGENVGTFALTERAWQGDQAGWCGEVVLTVAGKRFWTTCILVSIPPPSDEEDAGPDGVAGKLSAVTPRSKWTPILSSAGSSRRTDSISQDPG